MRSTIALYAVDETTLVNEECIADGVSEDSEIRYLKNWEGHRLVSHANIRTWALVLAFQEPNRKRVSGAT